MSEAKLAKRAAEADARRLAEAARDHLTGHEGGISGTDLRNALRLYDAAHSGDEHAHEHAWETYRRQEVCTLTKCRDCGEVRWTPTPAPSKSGDPASRACYYSLEDADGNPSNCTRPNGHDGPHAIGFTDATAHSDPPARAARTRHTTRAEYDKLGALEPPLDLDLPDDDAPAWASHRAESAAVEQERCGALVGIRSTIHRCSYVKGHEGVHAWTENLEADWRLQGAVITHGCHVVGCVNPEPHTHGEGKE